MRIYSDYMHSVFDPKALETTHVTMCKALRTLKRYYEIDTIAFTGMSGASIAFLCGRTLKMPVLCVRKDTDTCHSCFRIEGNIDAKKCVIVDDFISTGKTVKFICKMLKDSYKAISCEAVLLYTPCASGLRYQWIDAYQKYIPCFYSRDKDITKNIKTQGRIPKDTFDLRKIQ